MKKPRKWKMWALVRGQTLAPEVAYKSVAIYRDPGVAKIRKDSGERVVAVEVREIVKRRKP